MEGVPGQTEARRRFLRMLAASPLFASSHFFHSTLTTLLAANVIPEGKAFAASRYLAAKRRSHFISGPGARCYGLRARRTKALPPAHFGYLATGVDDDGTVRANRDAYSRIQIRPRRLVDVEKIDMSVRLFGNYLEQSNRDITD